MKPDHLEYETWYHSAIMQKQSIRKNNCQLILALIKYIFLDKLSNNIDIELVTNLLTLNKERLQACLPK